MVSSYPLTAASSGGAPPNTTPINRKRDIKCARGYKRCPIYSGLGGFDCVNTRSDTENCGGCVSIDGVQPTDAEGGPAGVDCTAIPDVSMVQCVKSQCIIRKSLSRLSFSATLTSNHRYMPEGLREVPGWQELCERCRCRWHYVPTTPAT